MLEKRLLFFLHQAALLNCLVGKLCMILRGQPRGSELEFCLSDHALLRFPRVSICPPSPPDSWCVSDSIILCSFTVSSFPCFLAVSKA